MTSDTPALVLFLGIVAQLVGALLVVVPEGDTAHVFGYLVLAVGGLATFIGAVAVAVVIALDAHDTRQGD